MGAPYFERFDPKGDLDRTLVYVMMPELQISPESLRVNYADDMVQFAPGLFNLHPSVTDLHWPRSHSHVGKQARLLAATMRTAFIDLGTRPKLWQRLHETGLTVLPGDRLHDYIDAVCHEANSWGAQIFPGEVGALDREEAISILSKSDGGRSGRYWGPALRAGDDSFCVDLLSACLRLESTLAEGTAGGGSVSGSRGRTWEEAVQATIDSSKCRPTGDARKLISKKLRIHRQALTDVDAVAIRGKSLLIVSCKSWQLSIRYENGDFHTRKNKARDLVVAAAKLHRDLLRIRDAGVVSGFDFRPFSELSGYLCVSTPLLILPAEMEELKAAAPDVTIGSLPELLMLLDDRLLLPVDGKKWAKSVRASYRLPSPATRSKL
jgi:hypothetical protein